MGEMYVGGEGVVRGYLNREEGRQERVHSGSEPRRREIVSKRGHREVARGRGIGVHGESGSAGEDQGIPDRNGRDRRGDDEARRGKEAVAYGRRKRRGEE